MQRIFSSVFLATGLGAAPYGIAVAAGGSPSSADVQAEKEANVFGETCLLDEDMCSVLKEEDDYEEDQEETSGTPKWDVDEKNISEQKDDFCSWGFDFDNKREFDTLFNCSPEPKETTKKK